jgi:PAS domain S-box-containing protein
MNPDIRTEEIHEEPPFFSRQFALPAIVLLTALGIALTVVCVSVGYTIVFQNIFYFPIILMGCCYPKRGMLYATLISLVYFFLILGISRDMTLLFPALVRVVFFEVVAGFIVYLSIERHHANDRLAIQKKNLSQIIDQQTECLNDELQQSLRLEKAYRDTSEYYENLFNRPGSATVICNAELYITKVNDAFTESTGASRTELIGRKIFSISPFDQMTSIETTKTVMLEIPRNDGTTARMLWGFSVILDKNDKRPSGFMATGLELPKEGDA